MIEIAKLIARWIGGLGAVVATAAVAAQGDALLVTGSNVNVRAGPSTEAGILARVGIDEPANELRRVGQWVEVELPQQDVLGWIHASLVTVAPADLDRASQDVSEQNPTPLGPRPLVRDNAPTVAAIDDDVPAAAPSDSAPQADTASQAAGPAAASSQQNQPPTAMAATTPPGASPDAAGQTSGNAALDLFRSDVEHFNSRALAAAGVDLFTGVERSGTRGVKVITTDAWAIMSRPGQQSYLNALFGRWQAANGGGQDLRLEIVDPSGVLMMERTGP